MKISRIYVDQVPCLKYSVNSVVVLYDIIYTDGLRTIVLNEVWTTNFVIASNFNVKTVAKQSKKL